MSMWTLFSISFVLGVLIFIILISLISLEDQWAKIYIRKNILNLEFRQKRSWKKGMNKYLDVINYPEFLNQIVNEKLVILSGIKISHRHFIKIWWLFCLFGIFEGVIILSSRAITFPWVSFSIFLVLCNSTAPYFYLKYTIFKRRRDVERSLPDYLDMLTLTVEAGFGLIPAIKRINDGFSGVLGQIMNQFLFQLELGYSKRDALNRLSREVPSPDVHNFSEAILLSERLGTSLSRIIRIQAGLMRTRRRQRAEAKAQIAPIRIIPALVFFFLPSLLLIYLAPPIINFLFRQ